MSDASYQKQWVQQLKARDPEAWRAYNRKGVYAWRKKKGEAYRLAQRKATRASFLKRAYGITIEDWDRMYADQGGVCAICRQPESAKGRRLAVDHCHETGRVRGLLCTPCNRGLGYFRHARGSLLSAAAYLETHHG